MKAGGADLLDVLAVVGFVALEIGVALVSVPAAFVVAGVLLLTLAVWPHVRRRRADRMSGPER